AVPRRNAAPSAAGQDSPARLVGGAREGADSMQGAWLSQTSAVLKTGSGRQGHSWVRIPPPPLRVSQRDSTATDRATDATVVPARRRSVAARSTVTSPFSTDVVTSQCPADARLNEP